MTDREEQFLSILARSTALALENAELHKRTEELTIIDELTETYNYRYFIQKLQEEKKRALRYDLPVSLIMVDIDWFKKLNDTYGHEIGNVVLKDLSRIIKRCIRDVDIFARYGGEEFVIILPQTASVEATHNRRTDPRAGGTNGDRRRQRGQAEDYGLGRRQFVPGERPLTRRAGLSRRPGALSRQGIRQKLGLHDMRWGDED